MILIFIIIVSILVISNLFLWMSIMRIDSRILKLSVLMKYLHTALTGYKTTDADKKSAKGAKKVATKGPVNKGHYHPQESTPRYPLELDKRLHINLWSDNGEFKWTIAFFIFDDEGPEVRFVGDRPFDERINWEHFHELLEQGQGLANRKFNEDKYRDD